VKLPPKLRETIAEVLLEYQRESAEHARGWTRASVRKLLHDQFGISYSTPYLSRVLRTLGFRFDLQTGWAKPSGHNTSDVLDATDSKRQRPESANERGP
jgi:transposase